MAKNDINQIREDLKKTKINELSINSELQNSFLEYAMSVIVARAIPDARDGLKPVHRRVLYAAYNLGLSSDKPHKKSARIVGEVLGKFHPHGDTAAYEAMVRMAQDFSMRYTLIDGHGNFGSTDDGPAAMRYTEARLSKLADTMLLDIDKDTVDFVDNYDGSEKEPCVLTSSFPNLLANGCSGIAVGIATNIPSHNLSELVKAIKLVAKNPNTTVEEIKTVITGPDFPTGAELVGIDGIDSYFKTGRGSVTIRSKCEIKTKDNGKSVIVVTEIPYMVGKNDLLNKITDLVKNKTIEGITDLQDYSNREGIHIEIETKKDVVAEVLLNQLYKMTPLQVNFAVNMIALVNGEPKLLSIIDAIKIYIDHQINVLVRKLKNEFKTLKERAHILEGLYIATQHIDEIIKIIKEAEDTPSAQAQLIAKYNLTELQAKAILDMKLRSLSGLERQKIHDELLAIKARLAEIDETLKSYDKQIDIIIGNLEALDKKFGDNRKTVIRTDLTSDIEDEDLIPKEDILITLSNNGYLKRLPIDTFRQQNRGGVGVTGLSTHDDDDVYKIINTNTHIDLLMFTNLGKVYRVRGHNIPSGSRISKGIPAINIIEIEKNEKVITILPIENYHKGSLFFCTELGRVKKTQLTEFDRINRSGKIAISLNDDDMLFDVMYIEDSNQVFIGASNGKMVRFNNELVRNMGRTAAGVGGINLEHGDKVVGLSSSLSGNKILSIGQLGIGKLTPVDEYRETNRNAKGVITLKITPKTGKLSYIGAVNGNEDILMIASSGKIIRTSLSSLHDIGRSTSGVKLINLDGKDKVKSITIFNASISNNNQVAPIVEENKQ